MRLTTTADRHDLFAAERFLAAEARIAATFGRVEEAVAPLLRAMRATGRTTYATDPERGARSGGTPSCGRPTPRTPRRSGSWPGACASRTAARGGTGPIRRCRAASTPWSRSGPGASPSADRVRCRARSSPWLVGAGRRGRLPRGGASLARASRRARRHGRGAGRVDPGPAGRPQDGAARPRGRMRRRKEARRALHHHGLVGMAGRHRVVGAARHRRRSLAGARSRPLQGLEVAAPGPPCCP